MCVCVCRCRERDFLKKVHECLEREGKVRGGRERRKRRRRKTGMEGE